MHINTIVLVWHIKWHAQCCLFLLSLILENNFPFGNSDYSMYCKTATYWVCLKLDYSERNGWFSIKLCKYLEVYELPLEFWPNVWHGPMSFSWYSWLVCRECPVSSRGQLKPRGLIYYTPCFPVIWYDPVWKLPSLFYPRWGAYSFPLHICYSQRPTLSWLKKLYWLSLGLNNQLSQFKKGIFLWLALWCNVLHNCLRWQHLIWELWFKSLVLPTPASSTCLGSRR